MHKQIHTQFKTICKTCRREVLRGELIMYDQMLPLGKRMMCMECYSGPKQSKNTGSLLNRRLLLLIQPTR